LKCCERCKNAWYCSKECQDKAWKTHQYICTVVLPKCHYCDEEFEKLLSCGRCKAAFYCSRNCQSKAWKDHKNVCRTLTEEVKVVKESKTATKPETTLEKASAATQGGSAKGQDDTKEKEDDEDDEDSVVQTNSQFRQELLSITQMANAKMVQAMQDSRGELSKFLPQVLELQDEYHERILDQMRARSKAIEARDARRAAKVPEGACPKKEDKDEEDQLPAAVALGQGLMKEVIMALLRRGLSTSACVDQLDLANNHFNAGIIHPRDPSDFALEDGDLDGFEPAVTKLKEKGLVSVAGLLDDDIASEIHDECCKKFWDCRKTGAMRPTVGVALDGYECWLPFPPRKGTGPMLDHALRILFALPHEFQRNGYPAKLKVPTMAHLSCFVPHKGRERLHLDNSASKDGGRELTFILFCTPQRDHDNGGALRAYVRTDDEDYPGPFPKDVALRESGGDSDSPEQADGDAEAARFRDFTHDAGSCLVFRSRELWHEMLVADRLQFALTLFVQRTD
jgi:hypothetical protein